MNRKNTFFEINNDVSINPTTSQIEESHGNTILKIEDVIFPEHFNTFDFTVGQGKMCSISRS